LKDLIGNETVDPIDCFVKKLVVVVWMVNLINTTKKAHIETCTV